MVSGIVQAARSRFRTKKETVPFSTINSNEPVPISAMKIKDGHL